MCDIRPQEKRDTLDMTHRCGDLIIYSVNINTLMVELEEKTVEYNCILSRNKINVQNIKVFFLKTYMQR